MALPKLETPKYQLVLPSTNEKINYRPFLVREQKILLMAQDAKDEGDIANAVGELVKACTFGKVDPLKAPLFDIEYIFLQIRAKSIGENAELQITCPDDNKTRVSVKINLQEVNVQMTANHTNEIQVSNDIKLFLRYPLLILLFVYCLCQSIVQKLSDVILQFLFRVIITHQWYHHIRIWKHLFLQLFHSHRKVNQQSQYA